MKISIVIATYNRGASLVRTLRSLAGQTFPASEWEVVAVNNNGSDDTPALFAAFAAEHPELSMRLVDEPRQGLSWARNRGIAESSAPVVAIIDDDEEVNPGFVAAYADFFDRHPSVVMAGGRVVPMYETGRPRWMSRFTERPIAGTLDLGGREKPFHKGYPAGGNMAVRRSALDKYGAFDTSLGRTGATLTGGEEKELFGRIAAACGGSGNGADRAGCGDGPGIWYVPGAVVYHMIPPGKLTADYFRRLSRGCGVSERVRTKGLSGGAYGRAVAAEVMKWGATIVLALWYVLTQRPAKARYLIMMRAGISRGLLTKI